MDIFNFFYNCRPEVGVTVYVFIKTRRTVSLGTFGSIMMPPYLRVAIDKSNNSSAKTPSTAA
jgi:hypothetical protein